MPRKKARPILVIDAETDPFKAGRIPKPFLWGCFDGSVQTFYATATDLMAYLRKRGPCVVYAHNGGRFDFHYLNAFAEPYTRILSINGRVAKWISEDIEFRDSYCILPVPLASYQKTEIDYDKFEAEVRDRHMPEIRAYLADDCRYLWELVTRFIDTYGRGITLATCAMQYWLEQSGRKKPLSSEAYYKTYSRFYYGGRVQCFTNGRIRKAFSMFDIRSAYPFAMLHQHPFDTSPSVHAGKGSALVGFRMYTIKAIAKGSLPFRDASGSITFPDDDSPRVYTVTGWEVMAAIDTKTVEILRWIEHHVWTETVDFKNYIYHFYEMKKSSKEGSPEYIFAKLFMNSLYGKFCSNPDKYDNLVIIPQLDIMDVLEDPTLVIQGLRGPWRFAGTWGEKDPLQDDGVPPALVSNRLHEDDEHFRADEQAQRIESAYLNVATGASITGFVRAYLWRHICKVRALGGVVHYCDTDSITCTVDDRSRSAFALSKELGDWGCDGNFSNGAIGGKKLYAFQKLNGEWKTACKGAKLDAESILRVADGEKILWENAAPTFKVLAPTAFVQRTIQRTGI